MLEISTVVDVYVVGCISTTNLLFLRQLTLYGVSLLVFSINCYFGLFHWRVFMYDMQYEDILIMINKSTKLFSVAM
jgi:hypothetical protein